MTTYSKRFFQFLVLTSVVFLNGCQQARPDSVDNICKIFRQYPDWYWATMKVEKRWAVPISVQMAILHQESRFTANARPPRSKLLWIIPWTRPSSAYGYTQALKLTWERYRKSSGNHLARRDGFDDAVDFIGWYARQAKRRAHIQASDAYNLYLAYHEGIGGYNRKTYLSKRWVMNVARKVNHRALIYDAQLTSCRASLKRKPWYKIW